MIYPHLREFRHGKEIVYWTATVAGVVAMFVPGEPYWSRMLSIPGAYFLVGASFGAGWLVAPFFRLLVGGLFRMPRFAIGLCLFYLYGILVGALLMVLVLPFDPERPVGQELREVILWLPGSFGFAAGIRYVLLKYADA